MLSYKAYSEGFLDPFRLSRSMQLTSVSSAFLLDLPFYKDFNEILGFK